MEIKNRLQKQSEYYLHFDVMKGIAIILVVMGHVMLFSFDINPSEPSKSIYFNMPLFFYISGYLAYKPISSSGKMVDRLLRRGMVLLIPYIVFFCLYDYFSRGYIDFRVLLAGGSRYWFLYILFLISSFFIIYEYIISKITHNKICVITLGILPYIALVAVKLYIDDLFGGVIVLTVNYYRYFLIGYICRQYPKINNLIFNNSTVAAIGLIAYFMNWYYFDSHNILLILFGTLGAIVNIQALIKYVSTKHIRICYWLSYIGKCSLGIYVIHYFFLPNMSSISGWLTEIGNPFIVQFTASTFVTLPIVASSILVYKLIERNKCLFFLFFGKLWVK